MQENSTYQVKQKKLKAHNLDRLGFPYEIWLYVLTGIPMILMIMLSFMTSEGLSFDEDTSFTFSNFAQFAEPSVLIAFWNSIKFSVLTTLICLVIGYIVSYELYRSKIKNKYLILLLLILPMWTNILIRIEALYNLMQPNNIMTDILSKIFKTEVVGNDLVGTDFAVLIGLVFTYLPFVILPIYTSLEKIDPSLEEAALDLGLTKFKKFWKVVFPLTLSGVTSGAIMVALPCMSGFAIPKILGEGNILLIGNIIEQSFINMDYNVGSLLAMVILVVILGAIMLSHKFDKEGATL